MIFICLVSLLGLFVSPSMSSPRPPGRPHLPVRWGCLRKVDRRHTPYLLPNPSGHCISRNVLFSFFPSERATSPLPLFGAVFRVSRLTGAPMYLPMGPWGSGQRVRGRSEVVSPQFVQGPSPTDNLRGGGEVRPNTIVAPPRWFHF